MTTLQKNIEELSCGIDEGKVELSEHRELIEEVIWSLDRGELRVAAKDSADNWRTAVWIKKAILYYFQLAPMEKFELGPFQYYDKIPLKTDYDKAGVRVVPPATARRGSFLEPGVVLMPSYVNIGAYIGAGTMVDTWATVGSCAQIGAGVHLSGGVGIGGVLEPEIASPVIVEDGAFIGSRAVVVEGVHIGREAVLAANVTLTASTPIIDVRNEAFVESKGFVPERAVVLPGTKEKRLACGSIYTACAYIVGERKESTDRKLSLTQVLRDFAVPV